LHVALVTETDAWQQASALGNERNWLSASESARLATLKHDARRQQFLGCRWLLRQMMKWAYPDLTQPWQFTATAGGAPTLPAQPDLHFSLSHSGALLLAVVADQPVGVDLERLQSNKPRRPLAELVCHPQELQQLQALTGTASERRVLEYWVIKEAWGKAHAGAWPNVHRYWLQASAKKCASIGYWWQGDYVCAIAAERVSDLLGHGLLAATVQPACWGRMSTDQQAQT